MKKLLLAGVALAALGGSAVAADLARPAYAPPPPVYTWTGLYWGVNVGYSWGHAKDEVTLAGVGTFSESRKVDRDERRGLCQCVPNGEKRVDALRPRAH